MVSRSAIVVITSLCLVAAVVGGFLGSRSPVTETQVIEAAVKLYKSETEGMASDCVGVPGRGEVWIEVRCGEVGLLRTYRFDEQGDIIVQPQGEQT